MYMSEEGTLARREADLPTKAAPSQAPQELCFVLKGRAQLTEAADAPEPGKASGSWGGRVGVKLP